MAVTTHSIVLAWGPDWDFGPWGDPTHVNTESKGSRSSFVMTRDAEFRNAVGLISGETSGTYTTYLRTLGALHSWGSGEIMIRESGGTGVKFRATDGVTQWYWTGSAWVEATDDVAHWTDYDELYEALPLYTGRTLGFVFRLTRTRATDTSPMICGVKAVARIMFAQTEADENRASSWLDDALHRILIGGMNAELEIPGVDEFTAEGTEDELDYSDGVDEFPYVVVGVEAVFDATEDPTLRTEVPGTWSGSAKTWTPNETLTEDHRYHVRFLFRPVVAHMADDDEFIGKVPAVLLESVTEDSDETDYRPYEIVDLNSVNAVVVDAPSLRRIIIAGRILTARATDRDRIIDAIKRWLVGGVAEVSPSTSLMHVIFIRDINAIAGSDFAEGSFSVVVEYEEWPGIETDSYRLAEHGVEVSADERE